MCGRKPKSYVHSKYSKKCESLLSTLLNINVTTESDDIFPSVVCNSCYITVKKAKEDDTITNILTTNINLHGKHTMISVKYAWRLVGIPVVEDRRGGGRGDQGMMNQLFSVETLWKELVILTHLNLRISHLSSAFSFLLAIWMTSAVTTVIAFPISQ